MKQINKTLLTVLCLTAVLCGCGKTNTPETSEPVTEAVTEIAAETTAEAVTESEADEGDTAEGESLTTAEIALNMVKMLSKNGAKNVKGKYVSDKKAYRITYSDEGLAAISYAAPDKPEVQEAWDSYVEWTRSSSDILKQYLTDIHSDADVYLELRNDENYDNALVVARNGEILYDVVKDGKAE